MCFFQEVFQYSFNVAHVIVCFIQICVLPGADHMVASRWSILPIIDASLFFLYKSSHIFTPNVNAEKKGWNRPPPPSQRHVFVSDMSIHAAYKLSEASAKARPCPAPSGALRKPTRFYRGRNSHPFQCEYIYPSAEKTFRKNRWCNPSTSPSDVLILKAPDARTVTLPKYVPTFLPLSTTAIAISPV